MYVRMLDPNSSTSICRWFVVQLVVQQNEVMDFVSKSNIGLLI